MADRIEREIEEILAKLDELPGEPGQPERKPISILERREKQRAPQSQRPPQTSVFSRINPSVFLFAGAGAVIGGLILSNVWSPLIWVAFAGVVVFLGGFVSAFFRRPRPKAGEAPNGHYWRDKYIEYTPKESSAWSRFKRKIGGH